jgi:hypothetical protein
MFILNIILFLVSIVALFVCREVPYLPVIVLELAAAFIAVANRDKPEIFVPLLILMFSKIIDVLMFDTLNTKYAVQWYLMGSLFLDAITYWVLLNFYSHPKMWLAAGCSLAPRRIPQVEFMGYVLLTNIVYNALVLAEVMAYKWEIYHPIAAPFFYSHQTTAMISLKFLMLLAIWSMTLDAYAVRKMNRHQMV